MSNNDDITPDVASDAALARLGPVTAGFLVFITSFVVLVIEIVAVRLLAPYVGITLETFTTIIGVVLAGIAAGTWGGGWLADRVPPRRLLGPLTAGGGLLIFGIIPVIRLIGPGITQGSLIGLSTVTVLALFAPAAVLSARRVRRTGITPLPGFSTRRIPVSTASGSATVQRTSKHNTSSTQPLSTSPPVHGSRPFGF